MSRRRAQRLYKLFSRGRRLKELRKLCSVSVKGTLRTRTVLSNNGHSHCSTQTNDYLLSFWRKLGCKSRMTFIASRRHPLFILYALWPDLTVPLQTQMIYERCCSSFIESHWISPASTLINTFIEVTKPTTFGFKS